MRVQRDERHPTDLADIAEPQQAVPRADDLQHGHVPALERRQRLGVQLLEHATRQQQHIARRGAPDGGKQIAHGARLPGDGHPALGVLQMLAGQVDLVRCADKQHPGHAFALLPQPTHGLAVPGDQQGPDHEQHDQVAPRHQIATGDQRRRTAQEHRERGQRRGLRQSRPVPEPQLPLVEPTEVEDHQVDRRRRREADQIMRQRVGRPGGPEARGVDRHHRPEQHEKVGDLQQPEPALVEGTQQRARRWGRPSRFLLGLPDGCSREPLSLLSQSEPSWFERRLASPPRRSRGQGVAP